MSKWLGLIILFCFSHVVYGDCTGPAGPNGAVRYDSSSKTMKFCGNDTWNEVVNVGAGDFPIGAVVSFALSSCPTGYLLANGSAVSRTTYSALFAEIAVMYGNGDGSTTFNLPDLRGRFLRGVDGGVARDPGRLARTDRGDGTTGDVVGTNQDYALDAHSHGSGTLAGSTTTNGNHSHSYGLNRPTNANTTGGSWRVTGAGGGDVYPGTSTAGNHSHSVTINAGATASSGGNEARPTNIAVLYCVKASS